MKKKSLALIQFQIRQLSQMQDVAINSCVESIQGTMSTLATLDPETALHILGELEKNRPAIEALIKERAADEKEFVDFAVDHMPDSMELEDGDEESDEDPETESH